MDDNNQIISAVETWYPFVDAVKDRLAIGVKRYGHGVRVNDDTTQWGTKIDSWLEMGLEEIDDLAIYLIAQLLREAEVLSPASEDHSVERTLAGRLKEYVDLLQDLKLARQKIMNLMETG